MKKKKNDPKLSFDAALMLALRADMEKELDELPSPEQLRAQYPDTSRWDARLQAALGKKRRGRVWKRAVAAALASVFVFSFSLAASADFRNAVYTMVQKFLPIEMQLTYEVEGEPLERLPAGYREHYVPEGYELDQAQGFEEAETFLHVYTSEQGDESYTVRCSIIQLGQQSLFDNEHTTYTTVKIGEKDASLGTSQRENGVTVYILNWEQDGIAHTIMGNIPLEEIMKIAESFH